MPTQCSLRAGLERRALSLLLLAFSAVLPCGVGAQELRHPFNPPPGPRPVRVLTHFFLSDINRIDSQQETFEIRGELTLRWQDPRHAFDAEAEGVAEKHYQGTFQFLEMYNSWWPQVVLANAVGSVPLSSVSLRIAPDGAMTMVQEISSVVKSRMELRRFPFDRQRLQVIFEPLAFDATEVRLETGVDETDLPERSVRVSGWELLALQAEAQVERDETTGNRYSILLLTLDVRRLPESAIWSILVPMSLIVLLSTVVFWMDRESLGNRMDVSFIGLLTIVAYQSLATEGLPNISYFTLLDGFLYVAYVGMAACIVSNVWVDQLDRRNRAAAADRFDWNGRWVFPVALVALNVISVSYFSCC